MKKRILLLVVLVMALWSVKAEDKTVSGDVSGTWTRNSTITVTNHITIPVGSSLTIEDGVKVLMADATKEIEFIVLGNFYCKGTESNPVTISVIPSLINPNSDFPRLWGGIVCGATCSEFLMLYTHVEYTGAQTTEESPSVKLGLYKAAAGEGLPIINFRNNIDGKLVVEHCTFNNAGEDGMYLEGGNFIIAYNTLYTVGETGGDMINLKAGSVADICYNLEYSPNTNGFKLSNSGDKNPVCSPICYNNTLVNCGWRRPTVKGGGIWLEAGVNAKILNNLQINPRFAVKNSLADVACVYDYQYYYGYSQETVDAFQLGVKDVVRGAHDIAGTVAGANDPMLVNYELDNDPMNTIFDTDWDFHLQVNSPAIGAGTTDFTRHFGTAGSGITIQGVEYLSPAPSTTIGAFGVLATGLSKTTENTFEVYPNPVKDNLRINLNSSVEGSLVQIYSLLGSKMMEKTVSGIEINIPVANLSNGVYYVTVKTGNNTSVCKFVKE